MSRLRPGSRLLTMLMAGLLAIGCWQLGEGSWIYAKAGLARLDSEITAAGLSLDRKNTNLGLGAGAQVKFGSFAIRAEYERFVVDGRDPSLLSLGFTMSFL